MLQYTEVSRVTKNRKKQQKSAKSVKIFNQKPLILVEKKSDYL